MKPQFIEEQLFVSTAEDEKNYFTGQPVAEPVSSGELIMPAGDYRVIDGEVFRVVTHPLLGSVEKHQK